VALQTHFKHEITGAPVTREQLMMVLQNIEALQIRGSFYTQIIQAQLSDVRMDIATPDGSGEVASNVEQCYCPPNYKGTSCEECINGYYRSKTGPYLGVCVPCQCNNKADKCDPDTGECVVSDASSNLLCKRSTENNSYRIAETTIQDLSA
jgi:laminin alpha 3/5